MKAPWKQKVILQIAWYMEALGLFFPALSLLPRSLQQGSLAGVIGPLLAIPWFIMYAAARIFWIPMGAAICVLVFTRDVNVWVKAATALVGTATCVVLLKWAHAMDHLW